MFNALISRDDIVWGNKSGKEDYLIALRIAQMQQFEGSKYTQKYPRETN